MSWPKANKSRQPEDVRPFWFERGFREEVALSTPRPGEDPKGEEAYQRAFYEAAQATPPRLPNPSHYPNSPSAREYMRKRSTDVLNTTIKRAPEKRPSDDSSDISRTARRLRDPDRSPSIPSIPMKQSASASPASNYSTSTKPPPFSILASPRTEDSGYGQLNTLPPFPPSAVNMQGTARLMEPMGAPSGPVNRPFDKFESTRYNF